MLFSKTKGKKNGRNEENLPIREMGRTDAAHIISKSFRKRRRKRKSVQFTLQTLTIYVTMLVQVQGNNKQK